MQKILKTIFSFLLATIFIRIYCSDTLRTDEHSNLLILVAQDQFAEAEQIIDHNPDILLQAEIGSGLLNSLVMKTSNAEVVQNKNFTSLVQRILSCSKTAKVINFINNNKKDMNEEYPFHGVHPLCTAANHGCLPVHYFGYVHMSPKYILLVQYSTELISKLLAVGADINVCSMQQKEYINFRVEQIKEMQKVVTPKLKEAFPSEIASQALLVSKYLYGQTPEQVRSEQADTERRAVESKESQERLPKKIKEKN